jgi:hypothetical protein
MKTAMHDPKFEKAVQDKMEQLEFIPSDSVWENIETAVAQRRRRAVPVFFWFLLAGLFLAGTGTAIYLRTSTPAGTVHIKQLPVTPGDRSPSGTPAAADQSVAGIKAGARPANAGLSADSRGWTTTSPRHGAVLKTGATPAAGATDPANTGSSADVISSTDVTSSAGTIYPIGAEATGKADPATAAARQHSYYQPGLISCTTALSGIKGPRLSPLSATKTAITGIPTPKRPWSAGFAGGFGVSSYNQSLLSRAATVTAAANALPTTAYQYARSASSSTTSSKKSNSNVEPGLSYWAGVVAQKPLSARLSLSLGLDLHYYSSSLHVGGAVTTYSRSASALIGASAVAPVQSYPY